MKPAQDEGELFDLVDADGRPLGARKRRADVHRDGDWHRSMHLWVWGEVEGELSLVLQRRAAAKDTHPRRLDVAVTGHLAAGETLRDALREAEEEIGLAVTEADVLRIGTRRRVDRSKPGVIDNEVQDILCVRSPIAIASLRPSEAELEAIVTVPLARAERVLREGGEVVGARLDGGRFVEEIVKGSELVPAPDGYYATAFASVAIVIGGGAVEPWWLG